MLKVRMLQRVNSHYGTFEAGDHVVNLPDDVAKAWVKDGIAEIPVRAAAAVGPPDPEVELAVDSLLVDDGTPEPVKTADRAGKRSSRKRTPLTHPSGHEGPLREDPKRPA